MIYTLNYKSNVVFVLLLKLDFISFTQITSVKLALNIPTPDIHTRFFDHLFNFVISENKTVFSNCCNLYKLLIIDFVFPVFFFTH